LAEKVLTRPNFNEFIQWFWKLVTYLTRHKSAFLKTQSRSIGNKVEKHLDLHLKTQSRAVGNRSENTLASTRKPN